MKMNQEAPSDGSTGRLTGIYRRLRKTSPRPGRFAWWQGSPAEIAGDVSGLLAITFVFASMPWTAAIRAVLFDGPSPPAPLLLVRPWLQGLLAAGFVIHAAFVDRWLESLTPRGVVFKPWLRWARWLLAGPPLIGLYVIPAWRWLLHRRFAWALETRRDIDLGRRSFLLWQRLDAVVRRRLATDATLPWFAAASVVLVLITFGLASSARLGSPSRIPVAAVGVALHLVAFAAAVAFLRRQATRHGFSGSWKAVAMAPSLCWLVPVPFFSFLGLMAVFVIFVLFSGEPPREQTLARTSRSGETATSEDRRRLQERARTGPSAPPVPTWTDDRLAWLYRSKTIILAFDAAGLAWVVMKIARWQGAAATIAPLLEAVAYMAFGVCATSFTVLIVDSLRKSFGRAPGRLAPIARGLAVSQYALCIGLLLGTALERGDTGEVAAVLGLAGLLGCVVEFGGLVLSAWVPAAARARTTRDEIFGLLGFLVVLGAGETVRRGPPYDESVLAMTTAFIVTAPAWGPVFVRAFSGWLLRPWDVKDALSRSTSRPLRRRLLFLSATLALPLGGLFVPWWICWRERQVR